MTDDAEQVQATAVTEAGKLSSTVAPFVAPGPAFDTVRV